MLEDPALWEHNRTPVFMLINSTRLGIHKCLSSSHTELFPLPYFVEPHLTKQRDFYILEFVRLSQTKFLVQRLSISRGSGKKKKIIKFWIDRQRWVFWGSYTVVFFPLVKLHVLFKHNNKKYF